MAQLVEAEKVGKKYRLRTCAYWYRLQAAETLKDAALIRWEYERADPNHAAPPRHHLHASATVTWNGHTLALDQIHTPSGWVTIEELIRFLIVELGVAPVTPEWPRLLADSEKRFFHDFTCKRL